jgi:cytochrome c oxidase subunit 2
MTTAFVAALVRAAAVLGRALLLFCPLAVAQAGDTVDSIRTIDVKLSRYAFSPERIEIRLGEPVRLNVASVDGPHGFEVRKLGLNVRTPARGRRVSVALAPKEAGTFDITCSEYCGSGHSRMKARLIVTPGEYTQ